MSKPVILTFTRAGQGPSSNPPDLIATADDLARAVFSWDIEIDTVEISFWPGQSARLMVTTPGAKMSPDAVDWIRKRLLLGVHVEFSRA